MTESEFLEAPLVRQADGELKNMVLSDELIQAFNFLCFYQ